MKFVVFLYKTGIIFPLWKRHFCWFLRPIIGWMQKFNALLCVWWASLRGLLQPPSIHDINFNFWITDSEESFLNHKKKCWNIFKEKVQPIIEQIFMRYWKKKRISVVFVASVQEFFSWEKTSKASCKSHI